MKNSGKLSYNQNQGISSIAMLKSDIMQIENMIKSHMDIITIYKSPFQVLNSNKNSIIEMKGEDSMMFSFNNKTQKYNNQFQKRCNDIQTNCNITMNAYFDNIKESSNSVQFLQKEFNCSNKDDLISRLATEVFTAQLFISKLNDLSFLINLKCNNNINSMNNSFMNGGNLNSQESLSKFRDLKNTFDKLLTLQEKSLMHEDSLSNSMILLGKEQSYQMGETGEAHQLREQYSQIIFQAKSHSTHVKDEDPLILEMSNINQFISLESKNPVYRHIKILHEKFCETPYNIFLDLINQVEQKNQEILKEINENFTIISPRKLMKKCESVDFVENFLLVREKLEDLINEKDQYITSLQSKFDELIMKNDKINSELNQINSEYIKVKNELNGIKINNHKSYIDEIAQKDEQILEILMKRENNVINASNEQVNNLSKKNNELEIQYQKIKLERDNFEKQLLVFVNTKKKQSSSNPNDSYEELLQEQMNDMKDAYYSEVSELKRELNKMNRNHKKEIADLEFELAKVTSLRDIHNNHVLYLKKHLINFQ
jgi:hypothetical protein